MLVLSVQRVGVNVAGALMNPIQAGYCLSFGRIPGTLSGMKPLRVVIDTNVLVAGLRSRRGASFALLQKLGGRDFIPGLSPPLCLEYEDVLARPGMIPGFSVVDEGDFVDYMVSVSEECRVYFLWRPWLPDPKDDLVLEVALAGGASHRATHNIRDFAGADELSLAVVTPDQFLKLIPIP